jgi:hypothetical protein
MFLAWWLVQLILDAAALKGTYAGCAGVWKRITRLAPNHISHTAAARKTALLMRIHSSPPTSGLAVNA